MTVMVTLGSQRLYEIMVLYDPNDATKDWDGLVAALTEKIEKLGGSTLKLEQWAENRKLAFELKGLRRGTYLSGYFYLEPKQQPALDRAMRLDEHVIRHIVLVHHELPPELKEKPKPEETEGEDGEKKDGGES